MEELKDAGGTGEKKTTEFKVEGDIFERFASGYDDDANPSIAYFTVPLKRVLREGRFGQVVLCGELEVFKRELDHALSLLKQRQEKPGIIQLPH